MADAYKGLTIRIGGDATGLQKALRSANSAISQTDTQLRRMKRALDMDPGNTEAVSSNLELVGRRAVEASSRLQQLRSAIREVGGQNVELLGGAKSVKTVQQLADETSDAAKRAAEAKAAYAEVVEQLARVRNEIQRVSGIDLDDEINPDEAVETMRELGIISDSLADKYARLRQSYRDAFDENEIAKQVAGFRDLENEATRTDAEVQSLSRRFSELSRAASTVDFGEGIDDRLRQVDAAAEDVQAELRRVNAALDMDPSSVENTALKIRDMQEASQLADERMGLLQEKLRRMNASGIGQLSDDTGDVALAAQRAADAYDEATAEVVRLKGQISDLERQQGQLAAKDLSVSDEYRDLGDQIDSARRELDRLTATQQEARAAFDTSAQVQEYRELQTQIAETRSQQSKLADEMSNMSRIGSVAAGTLTSLGMSLSTTVTPAMLAVGYGIVQSSNDIDSAYRDMRKTVNGTEEDFEALRDAALEFSTTNVTSADQILSIQAIGGELGVATDELNTFAETVANLDVATNLDAEDAATALGQLRNILSDLTGDTMPNFSDALVRLGNNGASTESQIADIASRIGAMASIVGMTTPEILAWSSTIASTGQGTEAAGTAISNTIRDIETAVAKGGDALQGFADVAGTSAEEFKSSWESSPSDALLAFIDGLNRIEDNGGSAITTLGELGITASRQTQAIQGLMQMINGTSDGVTSLRDNLTMSQDAWDGVSDKWGEAGDAAREADAKAEGFSGQLSILQNVAQNLGSEFGNALVPLLQIATDALQGLYDIVSDLPDGFKQAILMVGGLAGVLGPLILLGKGVGEFFGDISSGLRAFNQFKEAAKQVDALSTAATTATSTTGGLAGVLKTGLAGAGIALAVTGVAALVAVLSDEAEKARLADRATEGLSDSVQLATDAVEGSSESVKPYVDAIREIREANDETTESLAGLADEFDELNESAYAQVSQLADAYSAVRNYNGEAGLTAQQVGELKSAIDEVNEQCGTNYEVVRDASGAYYVMQDGARVATQAIYDLIDAQQKQVLIDTQNQKLSSLYEQQANALSEYNDAYGEYVSLQKDESDARQAFIDAYGVDPTSQEAVRYLNSDLGEEWGRASQRLIEYGGELDETSSKLENINGQIDAVNESIGNQQAALDGAYEGMQKFVMGSAALNQVFGGDADVMTDFSTALEDAGISMDYLAEMSDTDLVRLAQTWATNGGSVIDIINDLGIATDGMYASVQDMVRGFSGGEVSAALEGMGVSVDDLARRIGDAGITMEQLNQIGSDNFAQLVENCGGDIDQLIWQIQNYNDTPIIDKDGRVSVDQVELRDAQGNLYTWNGTELLDKDGNVVVDDVDLIDAQNNKVHWNGTDLESKDASVTVYDNGFSNMFNMVSRWNKMKLNDLKGSVSVTSYQRTVRTVETQSVGQGTRSVAQPQQLSALSGIGASVRAANAALYSSEPEPATYAAGDLARAATVISRNPSLLSSIASEASTTSSKSVRPQGSAPRLGDESSTRQIVAAIKGLRADIEGMGVVLDSGKLVGGISRDMNKTLGRFQRRGSLA